MRTLLLCLILAQDVDDRRFTELLEKMKSDVPAERESAGREITRIGPAAIPRLREAMKDDDLEFRARLKETIRAIEIGAKVKDLDRPVRTVTANFADTPLADIVRTLEEQTGTKIDASAVPEGHRFTFAVRQFPILQALDLLCGESDLLTYDWSTDGPVRLSVGKWLPYPAAYADGYRIRLKNLQVVRSESFQEHRATLQLQIDAGHDRALRPLRDPELKIEEAVDDQGTKLEAVDRQKQMRQVMMMVPGQAVPENRTFEFANLSPDAKRLALLRIRATYTYPTETQEVVIDNPVRGATQDLGRYKVVVSNATTDTPASSTVFTLSFSPVTGTIADMKQDIDSRFATSSVILVDDAGREHPAVHTVVQRFPIMEQKEQREVDFVFTVAKKLARSERKALKLQFHKDTHTKAETFVFKDVRLP